MKTKTSKSTKTHLRLRCPYCEGIAYVNISKQDIVEDGEFIWGVCEDCGASVGAGCLVTPKPDGGRDDN